MTRILLALLALAALPAQLHAQACTTEDFESFDFVSAGSVAGSINTYSFSISDTTVLSVWGQGPGLVSDGCTYSGIGATVSWSDAGFFGLTSKGIETAAGNGLALIYDQAVQTVSFDLWAYTGLPETVNVRVYDGNLTLLANQTGVSVPTGAPTPFSFQYPGIKRIEIQSLNVPGSPVLDNHVFCGAPPPPTISVLGQCGQPGSGIKAVGMTPVTLIGFAYSFSQGSAAVNVGGCGQVTIGLGAPFTVYATIGTDLNGEATLQPLNGIPAAACGNVYVQALDIASCTPSNVLAL